MIDTTHGNDREATKPLQPVLISYSSAQSRICSRNNDFATFYQDPSPADIDIFVVEPISSCLWYDEEINVISRVGAGSLYPPYVVNHILGGRIRSRRPVITDCSAQRIDLATGQIIRARDRV